MPCQEWGSEYKNRSQSPGFLNLLKIPIQQRVVLLGHAPRDGFFEKGEGSLAQLDVCATLMGKAHGEAGILPGIVDARLSVPRTVQDVIREAVAALKTSIILATFIPIRSFLQLSQFASQARYIDV